MNDWLSIGNEDLTYRPRAKAGDRVHHTTFDLICTVESPGKYSDGRPSNEMQFGVYGEDSFLVGLKGRLLPEWRHVS